MDWIPLLLLMNITITLQVSSANVFPCPVLRVGLPPDCQQPLVGSATAMAARRRNLLMSGSLPLLSALARV